MAPLQYVHTVLTFTDANVVLESSTRLHREDGDLIKHLACLVCSTIIACQTRRDVMEGGSGGEGRRGARIIMERQQQKGSDADDKCALHRNLTMLLPFFQYDTTGGEVILWLSHFILSIHTLTHPHSASYLSIQGKMSSNPYHIPSPLLRRLWELDLVNCTCTSNGGN